MITPAPSDSKEATRSTIITRYNSASKSPTTYATATNDNMLTKPAATTANRSGAWKAAATNRLPTIPKNTARWSDLDLATGVPASSPSDQGVRT